MRKIISLVLFMLFIIGCSTGNDVQWKEIGDEVIIRVDDVNQHIEMYYAEITLESGSKIAVKLGKPDEVGIFKIKNTFGKFSQISVYTDLDLK